MNRILLTFLVFFLSACSNPLNLHTSKQYFYGGKANIEMGEWFKARMAFSRAWTNAEIGNAEDNLIAVCAYEYGRASGAICDWNEAEKGLLKAYELDKKTSGPVEMSLGELALMYKAQGALKKSGKYFRLAKIEMDKVHSETRDSIGYANFLSNYAIVSTALGNFKEAKLLDDRSEEIRNVFKGKSSNHEQTPYGQFCHQNPQK